MRSLSTIARDIKIDWNIAKGKGNTSGYRCAMPYIAAMQRLDTLDDNYDLDTARSIVLYFLANAGSWRGETARRIKAELNKMLADHAKAR